MRTRFLIATTTAVLVALVTLACSAESPPTTRPTATATPTPLHWQLAIIHVGRGGEGQIPFSEETTLSRRLLFLVEQISVACDSDQQNIADMSVAGQNILIERGVDYPLLDLMELIHQEVLISPDISCAEVIAVVVTAISIAGG